MKQGQVDFPSYSCYNHPHPFSTHPSFSLNILKPIQTRPQRLPSKGSPLDPIFCSMSPAIHLFPSEISVNIYLHLFPHSFFATCCLSKLVDREFVICSHPSFKVLQRTAQVLKRRIKFYIYNFQVE